MRIENQNIYFASDYHIGHQNVIRFDGRPFKDLQEMHLTLIENWNSVVQDEDIVFYLGDFAFKDRGEDVWFRKQLNGKIYFIMGNHDKVRNISIQSNNIANQLVQTNEKFEFIGKENIKIRKEENSNFTGEDKRNNNL